MSTINNNEERLSRPGSEARRLQEAILEILREHEGQPDGLPTSGRFIFYELVQRGIISKKTKGEGGRKVCVLPEDNPAVWRKIEEEAAWAMQKRGR
jgi:hypothetical protein